MAHLSLLAMAVLALTFSGCSDSDQDTSSRSKAVAGNRSEDTPTKGSFAFPRVDPKHRRMTALMENAFGYMSPDHGMIDPVSGYPVEGWNHDPERFLFLRSFTQLTAIGQWIELLGNIAAGNADNPHISRDEALERLALAVKSLRHDQHDPKVSAKGLLGNFLGLEEDKRVGPLASEVAWQDIVDEFGEEKGAAIWQALKDRKWINPETNDKFGVVVRNEEYGLDYFDGALEPYGDDATKRQLMEIMDERVVMVAYGDNANLSTSVANAIGALLAPDIRDNPKAIQLRKEMEQILDDQQEGYRFLFDEKAGMLCFGWNASTDRYFGWEDLEGNRIIGHTDYLVNEFRGPNMFVLLRYAMPEAVIANLGFKIKPYRLQSGKVVHTLAPWEGSAFQAMGLSLGMQELADPIWRRMLKDVVDIELDYADRHGLPGFLSESYSGNGTEYTGAVGIPEIAVNPMPRVTDAPSLYTLGVAYTVAPAKVERLLDEKWDIVSKMMTDHGPWEGFNTTRRQVIEFQTSAHVLSFILGGLGTASENMKRYLDSKELSESLKRLYKPGEHVNFLSPEKKLIAWTPDGASVVSSRNDEGFHLRGDDVAEVGVTINLPNEKGVNLSGGLLKIRYKAKQPVDKVVIKLDRKTPGSHGLIVSEIFTGFAATDGREKETDILLPATPGLAGIKEVLIFCGSTEKRIPVDISITGFEFVPGVAKKK